MTNWTPRFNKTERGALERKSSGELEAMARTAHSDAYYAHLDGRNARAKELERKAMWFAKQAISAAKPKEDFQ